MLQLTPQRRIFLAVAPVDFRKGLEGLVAVCRQAFAQNPLSGGLYGFRHRTGTALKVLYYDGQGYWLSGKLHNASLCSCSGRGQVVMIALRFSRE